MVKLEDLYTVYNMARSNKRRSADAVNFEINCESNLMRLAEHINECTYRANGSYAFVSLYPQPREIFGCEMVDRIVQWYILWRVTPLLESKLIGSLHSNRKGKGIDAAIRNVYNDMMKVSDRYTKDAYVIQWDLKGYYPNASWDIACRKMQKLVIDHYEGEDKDSLLWMIMMSIHSNPQVNFFRKSSREMWNLIPEGKSILEKPEGTGGVIGFLIWQTAMNLYLDDVDHWIVDEMGMRYTRYADDCVIVAENKEAALTLLPLIREKYKDVGCMMHPRKFYIQHVNKGVKFLGAHIKFERIYIDNRVIRRAKERIDTYNRCINKLNALGNFLSTVNSYFGRMKTKNEFKNIERLWNRIDKGWYEYIEMDWDRLVVVAKGNYSHHKYINKRFKQIVKWKRWILSL